jgi:hypothetical protein
MLGLLGVGIVAMTTFFWFRLVQNVAVPRNRMLYQVGFVGGGLIGLTAVFQGGILSMIAGGAAAIVGLMFGGLRLQSAQKPNEPAVGIGDQMLAVSAPDENGVDFDLSSLRGKPYLLKFFRGHW